LGLGRDGYYYDGLRGEYSLVGPASVVVFRDGDHAVAVDGRTKEVIARSTDHREVIQRAIDQLTNGGKIFIKQGAYDIAASLDGAAYGAIKLNSNLVIEGEGYSTVLQASGINGRIVEAKDKQNITIKNIRLKSTEAALAGTNETGGLIFKGCSNVRLINVVLENFNKGSLSFYPRDYPDTGWQTSPPSHDIFIDKLTYTGPDYRSDGPSFSYGTYNVVYVNSFIHSRDESLVIVGGSHDFHIANCRFISEIGATVHLEVMDYDIYNIYFENCYIEVKGSGAYRAVFADRITAGKYFRDSCFVNCRVYNNSTYGNNGYQFRNARRVSIIGGVVSDVMIGVAAETDCSRIIVKGVIFYNCNINNVDLTVVKIAGVRLVDVTDAIVDGCSFIQGDNPVYGVSEEGASDYNVISNNNARGTSGISTVGTNTISVDNIT